MIFGCLVGLVWYFFHSIFHVTSFQSTLGLSFYVFFLLLEILLGVLQGFLDLVVFAGFL